MQFLSDIASITFLQIRTLVHVLLAHVAAANLHYLPVSLVKEGRATLRATYPFSKPSSGRVWAIACYQLTHRCHGKKEALT